MPGIRARVQVTEPTGPDLLAFVTLNDTKVCCRLAPDVACQAGDDLDLALDASKVLLFDSVTGERLRHSPELSTEQGAAPVQQGC